MGVCSILNYVVYASISYKISVEGKNPTPVIHRSSAQTLLLLTK